MGEARAGQAAEGVPRFGRAESGREYRDRPGAYAIMPWEERGVSGIVCVRTSTGLYLPGGGIDPGEEIGAALARECVEEAGLEVEIVRVEGSLPGGALCHARQLVIDAKSQGWDKDCLFFAGRVLGPAGDGEPTEADHDRVVLPAGEAMRELKLECDRWAVETWLARA